MLPKPKISMIFTWTYTNIQKPKCLVLEKQRGKSPQKYHTTERGIGILIPIWDVLLACTIVKLRVYYFNIYVIYCFNQILPPKDTYIMIIEP